MPCDGLREAWRVNRPGQSILGPQRNVTGVQASSRFNELGQTAGHCVYHASGLAGVGVPAGIDRWMLRHARYQCAVDLKIVPEPEVRSKSSPRSGNQRPLKRPDKRAFTRALQSTHTASGPAPGSRCTSHLGVLRRRSACDEPNVEWASPLAVRQLGRRTVDRHDLTCMSKSGRSVLADLPGCNHIAGNLVEQPPAL
jgi:hypothetical protein